MNEVTTVVLERPNMGRGGLSDAQGTQRRARTPVGRPYPFAVRPRAVRASRYQRSFGPRRLRMLRELTFGSSLDPRQRSGRRLSSHT